MLLDGAFTALLLMSGVSAVIVPPPTNVAVSCQNLKVTVSWEYSQQQPETSFRVHIKGATGESEKETTVHQYDLTPFIWAYEERYMDNFFVTVTAVQGGNQSEAVQSETFSFNYLKPTVRRCELDFPHVTLNVKEATVTFRNPLHFYSELKQADKPDDASFKFYVSSKHGDVANDCTVKEENCRCDISFPEGVDKCVSLRGMLFDGIGVNQVMFRQTGDICESNEAGVHVITLVVLLSLTAFIIIVITILICKAKAWTMETPSLPKPLQPDLRERDLRYDIVSDTDISAVGLTVKKKPLICSEEENYPAKNLQHCSSDFQPPYSSSMDRGLLEGRNQELEAVALISEGHRTDEDSADDSEKTECVSINLEEEEEERSPYDSPHVLQVDMGDGDMATGYTSS
ncbi:interferon gamma receptor 1 isoform X2 [Chelmon rostratus]|uniref:interferon gamma receptor 1 isoform X2 n=1 Tax=Chelmon rostratus TaxID=109905 RepID=UPI001BE9BD39|nr:interferon gamma receptor 1 isoform X2 [Chelmon rostratus]